MTAVRNANQRPVAHRTITGLDGGVPPLASAAHWATNPGGAKKARFYFDLAIRGTTNLSDEAAITFRPWVKHGELVAAGESVIKFCPVMAF